MTAVTLLIAFVLRLFALAQPPVSFAQEGPSTTPQIEVAKTSYFQKVNEYRTKESQFMVAREQYKQVQTLASLENAVKSSKEVQLARIDMLIAYFQALRETVNELKGAELVKKADMAGKLQSMSIELGVMRTQVNDATDRIGLDKASQDFDNRSLGYASTAYSALSLIRISNIQSATDQLGLLTQQTFDGIKAASPSATVFSEKQRGYDELARTIDEIKTILQKTNERIDTYNDQTLFTSSSYAQIVDMMNPAFTKLKLAQSYLKELAK